jgi:arsenate reductase
MIRASDEEPVIIEYLQTPLSKEQVSELVTAMKISVRDLLREKGTPFAELDLANPKWSDDQLLDFIVQHPILMNRPVVATPRGAALCRPSERVLDLLENPVASFTKEDGEQIKYERKDR